MKQGFYGNTIGSAIMVMLASWTMVSSAQADDTNAHLDQWLAQPKLQFSDTSIRTEALRPLYVQTNYQPVWVDNLGLTKRALQALEVIARADSQGLNPELYSVNIIRSVAAMPHSDSETALRARLSLEVLMSHAVMEYASDMHGGVSKPQWNTGKQALSMETQTALLIQAAATNDTAAYLTALAPTSKEYAALKDVFGRYQTIASNGGWPNLTPGKTIKLGMNDTRVATLRQILSANGDLQTSALSAQPYLYDAHTLEAVKRFQERHGIEADGVIGTRTQKALAVPVSERLAQIAMTMERMRWMPRDMGTRYVLVNIPSYTLTAVSGNDRLNMNVIVGKSTSKTPMFSKNITDVVLNPSWGVPAKIAVNEILPKARKNPDYLARAGYTVTATNGQVVNPHDIDWNSVDRDNLGYSFRQKPGDDNALGKVKFHIPDSDSIYLHDTAKRDLFVQANRSLSYGCVRLGDPKALTDFVLKHEGWDEAKIDASYESSTSRNVPITPLPVHFVYWTSWVDAQGRAHFGNDIYNMDKKLLAAMGGVNKAENSIKLAMN
jgi:murein L,D-transpeptidase YcbB/YkuD